MNTIKKEDPGTRRSPFNRRIKTVLYELFGDDLNSVYPDFSSKILVVSEDRVREMYSGYVHELSELQVTNDECETKYTIVNKTSLGARKSLLEELFTRDKCLSLLCDEITGVSENHKEDLLEMYWEDGNILEFNTGKKRLVLGNKAIDEFGFIPKKFISQDLINTDNLEGEFVIRVYAPNKNATHFQDLLESDTLLWEHPGHIITEEELKKKLGLSSEDRLIIIK